MKEITLNKKHVSEVSTIQLTDYFLTDRTVDSVAYKKGEKMYSCFLGRYKGIAKEDMINEWGEEDLVPRSEYNKRFIERENRPLEEYGLTLKDGIIYQLPYVKIVMSNGNTYRKYFNTEDECENYIFANFKNGNADFITVQI